MKAHYPNNYPREGEHNTVTASGIQKLEQDRPQQNLTVDYTIGGGLEAQVHTTIEVAREYAINRGHSILNEASQTIRQEAQSALEPKKLDMQRLKQEAHAHLKREFQSRCQGQSP